jgi:hypothetical protein
VGVLASIGVRVISATTQAIVDVIGSATVEYGSWIDVAGLSAADPAPAPARLTVALYAIAARPTARNVPVVGRPGALSSTLRYVMVVAGDHLEAQTRLEQVALALDQHPVIEGSSLSPALRGAVDRIAVRARETTDEERYHIWAALARPQMLGLYYDADVAASIPGIEVI